MRQIHLLLPLIVLGILFFVFASKQNPSTMLPFFKSEYNSLRSTQELTTNEIEKENAYSEKQQNRVLSTTSLNTTSFSGEIFSGTWNSNQDNAFGFFNGQNGNILLAFEYNSGLNVYNEVDMVLYDPQYDDGKKVYIVFNQIQFCDAGNLQWYCGQVGQVHEYEKRSLQSSQNDPFVITISMALINPNEGVVPSNVEITLILQESTFSSIYATLTLDTSDESLAFMFYNLFISAFGAQQLYSINTLTNNIQNVNPAYSTKLSMLTVGFIIVYDSYTSLAHLYMALEYTSYFYFFFVPTIIYFVMTTIIDMKLLIIIWKNRYYVNFETHAQVRKGFAIFYAKFYISLIVFFTLTYQFYLYNQYLMLFPLFIVPQIVHNYMKGNSSLSSKNYLIGTLLSRAIIPVYFRGCPENIRNLTPCLWFSIAYPLAFVLLIGILAAQAKFGPRFFVPRRFKGGYNYYRNYQTSDPALLDDCPICMSKLKFEPEDDAQDFSEDEEELQQKHGKRLLKKKKIVVTQCNHLYHINCFKAWINIKLECPACRHPLPPLFD